jgi:very-short-patch-repair endonuclease
LRPFYTKTETPRGLCLPRSTHFRKQHAVGAHILDSLCAKSKLVVEVDGDSHAKQVEYDAERTRWLNEAKHYRVVRFTNRQVLRNIEGVLEVIRTAL